MSSLEYHYGELKIASDPSNPARIMPTFLPKHKRILDIGCGMGQSLLAAELPSEIEAFGVDSEQEAIDAGRRIAPPNIKLACAKGEKLPFEDEYFDLVFSRVALPYMEIGKALREMSRVLKKDGDLWLALHPLSTVLVRARRSALRADLKGLAYCSYVLLNGTLFNCFGMQFSWFSHQETFQTANGVARAMKRAGLICQSAQRSRHFIVQGQKTSAGRDVKHELLGCQECSGDKILEDSRSS